MHPFPLLLGALCCVGAAQAETVSFSDGEFASGWSAIKFYDNTLNASATFSAGTNASGGFPGAYRYGTHAWGNTSPGLSQGLMVAHLWSGAVYDPSLGAIDSINIAFNTHVFSGGSSGAVALSALLYQDGRYYQYYSADPTGGWFSKSYTGLIASDFSEIGVDGANHPSFSSGAAPITFGIASANGRDFYGATATSFGFDNFSVSVAYTAAVPEPETWAMLLAGLGLVGWATRRRVYH